MSGSPPLLSRSSRRARLSITAQLIAAKQLHDPGFEAVALEVGCVRRLDLHPPLCGSLPTRLDGYRNDDVAKLVPARPEAHARCYVAQPLERIVAVTHHERPRRGATFDGTFSGSFRASASMMSARLMPWSKLRSITKPSPLRSIGLRVYKSWLPSPAKKPGRFRTVAANTPRVWAATPWQCRQP